MSFLQQMYRARFILIVLVALGMLTVAPQPKAGAQTAGGQFLAKMYTEALGRAPDQSGWNTYMGYFNTNGCNISSLQYVANKIYNSTEYANDYAATDYQARVITLYRGILSRDPDNGGLSAYITELQNGTRTWAQSITYMLGGSEFSGDESAICSTSTPDYGFSPNNIAPTTTPIGTTHVYTSQTALQNDLNAAEPSAGGSGSVCMAEENTLTISSMLTIPTGVTLSTCGAPNPTSYATMARLARTGTSKTTANWGAVVQVTSGGTLKNIWVDGQGDYFTRSVSGPGNNPNIVTHGSSATTPTTVSNNKINDTLGGSSFTSDGSADGHTCTHETISGNLVTAYSSNHGHDANGNADGLTMRCEGVTISGNDIVDVTDQGIVLFASPGVTQASTISGNTIVSAGNNINAPIAADPSTRNSGACGGTLDYTGTSFTNNTFWTSPLTTFAFGIAAGAREWFAGSDNCNGTGAVFTNNGTGTTKLLSANVRAGIAMSGMLSLSITNDGTNPLTYNLIPPTSWTPTNPGYGCPTTTATNTGVIEDTTNTSVKPGGSIPTYTWGSSTGFDHCISIQ